MSCSTISFSRKKFFIFLFLLVLLVFIFTLGKTMISELFSNFNIQFDLDFVKSLTSTSNRIGIENFCSGSTKSSTAIVLFIPPFMSSKKNIDKFFKGLSSKCPKCIKFDILLMLHDKRSISHINKSRFKYFLNLRKCMPPREENEMESENKSFHRAFDHSKFHMNSINLIEPRFWASIYSSGYLWVLYIDFYAAILSEISNKLFTQFHQNDKVFGFRMERSFLCSPQLVQLRQIASNQTSKDKWASCLWEEKNVIGYDLSFWYTKTSFWIRPDISQLLSIYSEQIYQQKLDIEPTQAKDIILNSILHSYLSPQQIHQFLGFTFTSSSFDSFGHLVSSISQSGLDDKEWQKTYNQMIQMHSHEKKTFSYEYLSCQEDEYQNSCTSQYDNIGVPCTTFMLKVFFNNVSSDSFVHCVNKSRGFFRYKSLPSENTTSSLHKSEINSFHSKTMVIIGISNAQNIPQPFIESLSNLKNILPRVLVYIGMANRAKKKVKTLIEKHPFIHFVSLHSSLHYGSNISSMTFHNRWRNQIYRHVFRLYSIERIDYLMFVKPDSLEYAISFDQWANVLNYPGKWDAMISNEMIDRTHLHLDNFIDSFKASRKHEKLIRQQSTLRNDVNWRIQKNHTIVIFQGNAWRAALQRNINMRSHPFNGSNHQNASSEYAGLIETFRSVYAHPDLVCYHHLNADPSWPIQKYKIILPRNAGFFSVFNFLIAALALPHRVYPYWNQKEMISRLSTHLKKNVAYFGFIGDSQENSFLDYFDPIEYFAHDKTMLSSHFNAVEAKDRMISDDRFLFDLIFPSLRDFWGPRFQMTRRFVHTIYSRFIRPKKSIVKLVDEIVYSASNTSGSANYLVGVHLRNPLHFVESGSIYYDQYFVVIDQLMKRHKQIALCIASDTDYALAAFLQRYGEERVRYFKGFSRASLDHLLSALFPLASGRAKLDQIGQLKMHSGKAIPVEVHSINTSSNIGREVLLDALMLSKCNEFVGISSNIALAVSYMNPDIKMNIIKSSDDLKKYKFK